MGTLTRADTKLPKECLILDRLGETSRLTGPFSGEGSKTFYVSDSPQKAREIIAGMTLEDGFGGSAPPGVSASRIGPGEFSARSIVGSVKAKFEVRPSLRGGSEITERFKAKSPVPVVGVTGALTAHSIFVNPEKAYEASRSRKK